MPDPDSILSPAECRRRRTALGWSFGRLAGRAMMSSITIKHFEKGRCRLDAPSWREPIALALALGESEQGKDR